MTWTEWKSLFRFDKAIDIPHMSIVAMTPYLFVRLLWWSTSKEHHAWPNEYDTGIVLGWRWPWTKHFKEKQWLRHHELPLALYGAMDQAYTVRAAKELGWVEDEGRISKAHQAEMVYIAPTIRSIFALDPRCSHKYWIANCPNCARKALSLAVSLTAKHLPRSVPDPREDPLTAFRRREAEAQAKMLEASK